MRTRMRMFPVMKMAAVVMAAAIVLSGAATAEPGSNTATFLLVPVGGRAVALGGAYTGLGEDPYAMHFNPAGIARSKQEIVFAHNEYVLDLSQEYLAYVHPLNVGALGISVNYFDLGNFDRTIITNVAAPNTPNSYGFNGRFDASNLALSVGYGRQLFLDGLYLGIAGKFIDQRIDNFSGQTAAVDLGAYYRKGDSPLSLGLSVLNIGDKMRMHSRTDRLPTTFRLGGAYRILQDRLIVTADVEKTVNDDDVYFHAGAEYWIAQMLALRIGYNGVSDLGSGLTAGAGFKMDRFTLDYAFSDEDELKQSHRISIGYTF